MLDNACPWCNEELYHPFTGEELKTLQEYDCALEAHVPECDVYIAEQG